MHLRLFLVFSQYLSVYCLCVQCKRTSVLIPDVGLRSYVIQHMVSVRVSVCLQNALYKRLIHLCCNSGCPP